MSITPANQVGLTAPPLSNLTLAQAELLWVTLTDGSFRKRTIEYHRLLNARIVGYNSLPEMEAGGTPECTGDNLSSALPD